MNPPARGDLVWLDFDPRAGHEQAGRRPGIVLSQVAYNRRVGLIVVCPITSRVKGFPFELALPEGLPIGGVVLTDQVKSVDWRARRAEIVGSVSDEFVTEVIDLFLRILR